MAHEIARPLLEVADYRLIFERLSRSGGEPHRVRVDGRSLKPLGCSCADGQHDLVCWAALEVAADECVAEAQKRQCQANHVLKLALERRVLAEKVLIARTIRRQASGRAA